MNCCGDIWSTILTFVGTGASIIIAILALYESCFKKMIFHPKLNLTWDTVFPYCNETVYGRTFSNNTANVNSATCNPYGNIIGNNNSTGIKAWSFKFKIENKGETAKNVKIYLRRVERQDPSGKFVNCLNVLPMNLVWSFQDNVEHPTSTAHSIAKNAEKYCDFIFVDQKSRGFLRTEVEFPVNVNQNTKVNNNDLCNTIPTEIYRCELIILASNAEPKTIEFKFKYTNSWNIDPKKIIEILHS